MDHRVLGLPFECNVKRRLICCGFHTIGDIKDFLDLDELRKATNLEDGDLQHVINTAKRYIYPNENNYGESGIYSIQLSSTVTMKSVNHSPENEGHNRHITSFSSKVDNLLGGGFPLGRIIEIAGEAGLGKSQFAFQLCVDVQIPESLGGINSEAVFLDVEGTFSPHRVEQIADASVRHCHDIVRQKSASQHTEDLRDFTVKNIMSHIYLFRCSDSVQLMASCHQMVRFLVNHKKVKMLVIDSIAHCLRTEDDYIARTKYLMTLKGFFLNLIQKFDLSIIIVNQVTTKIGDNHNSYNIPALGAKWSHVPNIKLMLLKQSGKRFLYQYKSPSQPDGIVEYCITKDGIRDVIY